MDNVSKLIKEATLNKIEDAIREGKVNNTNVYGETPLMFAVAEGYTDKVRTLINKGTDVRARTCSLNSALMYLANVEDKSKNKEILKLLSDNGARLNSRNKDGDTVLIHAIKKGNLGMMENLIDLVGIDVDLGGSRLKTPLMIASKRGDIEILKLLIQSGANIDKKDMKSNSAFIYAIAYNQQEAADILINEGAKVESHYIFSILKLIDKYNLNYKGLMEYLDYLVNEGAGINYHGCFSSDDREEYTPLMIALRGNMDYELIEALINAGADINPVLTWYLEDTEVRSATMYSTDHPLRLAIYYKDGEDIIRLLVREGAKVNMSKNCLGGMGELKLKSADRYEEYMTPLKLAVEQKEDQIADYLTEHGARYNRVDKDIWDFEEEEYFNNC